MVLRTVITAGLIAASIALPVSAAPAEGGGLRVVSVRTAASGEAPQVQPRDWAGSVAMYEDQVIPDAARIVLVPGSSIVVTALGGGASATVQGAGSPLEFHVYAAPGDRSASFSAGDDGAALSFGSLRGTIDIAHSAEFVVAGRPERIEMMERGEGAQRTTFGVVVTAPAVVNVLDSLPAKGAKSYPLHRGLLRAEFPSAQVALARYRGELEHARAARTGERRFSDWDDRRIALALNNEGVALGDLNVRDALARFSEAIRTFPGTTGADAAIAYYNRGLAYAKANRLREALADYTRAIRLDPRDSSAYNNRGAVYSMLEQSEDTMRARYQADAIRDYTTAAALDRADPTARTNLGLEYLRRNQPEKAIGYLREATTIAPRDSYALDDLAVADMSLNRDADARRDLALATERGGSAAASYNLGLEDERAGERDAALKEYRDAVSRDPRFSEAYDRIGAVDHTLNREDDARHAFDRAIFYDPRRARYYSDRAVTLLALNDLPAAIGDLKEAQRLGDTDAGVAVDLGGAYRRQNDLKDALDAYDAALRRNPHDFDALLGRADVYRIEGDDARAIADDTAAIAVHPDAKAYDARGEAYRHSGDVAHAIADFQEAIARDPGLARAHADLAAAYLIRAGSGDVDLALKEAKEAVRLAPDEGQYHADLAAIELQKGDAAAASAEFGKAAEILPTRPYIAVMREIADRQSNSPRHLAQAVAQLDMNAWPAPLVNLYLGKASLKDALEAARHSPPTERDRHVCEATFYAADLERLDKHENEARRLYSDATTRCAAGSSERAAATYALQEPPK